MPELDLGWVRAQFPALAQEVNGRPAVFFDGPGGTQVPQRVIDAIGHYLVYANANSHGPFATSERTDEVIVAAHTALADLLGCDPDEVVFGPNMTTLTFQVSRALGREIAPGDEIVLTRLDHDANVAPWMALEERGAVIRFVDVDVEDCTLDMADVARAITPRTRLVALGYASNAVGTINDVAAVTRMAHDVGALVYVDAVHYAPHGPIDVRALDCDFLACSPYKFFAPHAGTLYGKREHLQRLRPYKVRPATEELPGRWMTGTQSHEAMAGVTAAVEYLADLGRRVGGTGFSAGAPIAAPAGRPVEFESASGEGGAGAAHADDDPAVQRTASDRRRALLTAMSAIRSYERGLSERLVAGLLAIPGLTLYGIADPARFDWRTPTVSVRLAGHAPQQLATTLGERGFFCWYGNYYAVNLTERLGVEEDGGMVRIGLVHYNTAAEVDALLETLRGLAA